MKLRRRLTTSLHRLPEVQQTIVKFNGIGAVTTGVVGVFIAYSMLRVAPTMAQTAVIDSRSEIAPYATPAEITLQPLGKAAGYSLDKQSAAALPRDDIVYADSSGLTLYTFSEDPINKSVCIDACEAEFPPLLSSSRSEPYYDWTLVERHNGEYQWALGGKPLYRFHKDVDPGSVAGNSPAVTGAPRLDSDGKPVGKGLRGYTGEVPDAEVLPTGWSPAQLFPMPQLDLPPGVKVKEIPDVSAFVLVDRRNHTLYSFDGEIGTEPDLCATDACIDKWKPFSAPLISRASGEFNVVDRSDGIRQWTYKGKGLYTFSGDLAAGYANGAVGRSDWRVAAVLNLYNPPGVTIEQTLTRGAVLAADGGRTLYRRDGHIFQSGGGHNLRRGAPARPAVGRDIGTDPRCEPECLEVWFPFIAPDDALPRGFWDTAIRDDGRKQWRYQGYALWTFAGDKSTGDMLGHDIYDIKLSHDPDQIVEDVGTPMAGGVALWWSIAVP